MADSRRRSERPELAERSRQLKVEAIRAELVQLLHSYCEIPETETIHVLDDQIDAGVPRPGIATEENIRAWLEAIFPVTELFAVKELSGHLPYARQGVGELLEQDGPAAPKPGQPATVEVTAVDQVREPVLVFGDTELAECGVDGIDG